jgi:hypothetical protein
VFIINMFHLLQIVDGTSESREADHSTGCVWMM